MPYQEEPAPPSNIASQLPALALLQDVLLANPIDLPPGHPLRRAAWNMASVWPLQVTQAHRFGPPPMLIGADRRFPFHWVYAADHVVTAAWEAQFCANDVTRPGTFHMHPGAADALIATLTFAHPLRLLDLTGTAASKLGLYDPLRSPNHEWCKWFGWRLDQLIAAEQGAVHGFRYPSRRHPGYDAYAISSRVMDALSAALTYSTVKFRDTAEFGELARDPCCVPPP